MRLYLLGIFIISSVMVIAQENDSIVRYENTADKLLKNNKGFTIGGYGQLDYNQPISSTTMNNGTLDVHRLVMLFGYNFNEHLKFVSEIEYEHVKEVFVEQAFLQYKLNNYINLRGGLMLIPMGIINEYHEPPTFNGVERPMVDKYIAPTTWRELGLGITGNIIEASLKYQLYVVNGFNGYDGNATLNGKNGLRKGRQKGADSYISSPNFTGKVEYYGIRGLNIGLSGYLGKTQSTAYDKLERNDDIAIKSADSTVVGVSMVGLDLRYQLKGLALRGQLIYSSLDNTTAYNQKLSSDLGSEMIGYYAEVAYDVFSLTDKFKSQLIPFVRYEVYDTHSKVEDNIVKNNAYYNTFITAGISWKITPKVVVKSDYQFYKSNSDNEYSQMFNAGIGLMF
ncbi:MAG: hypothetical protein HN347_00540 [Bacteroidetes bacterium]|jgi:hypothetical protein|nr:hypothetical protein [Bacteroidota bacterium]MBT6869813.1 hypothetical protein [archaeon]